MELFIMICLALLGVVMLAGGLATIGMIATLAVLLFGRLKRQLPVAWRWLWRREAANVAPARRDRTGRNAFLEGEARLARGLVSDLFAALGLTSISGYILWALAF